MTSTIVLTPTVMFGNVPPSQAWPQSELIGGLKLAPHERRFWQKPIYTFVYEPSIGTYMAQS